MEYFIKEQVHLVQETEHVFDFMKVDPLIFDSSDDESKVEKLSDEQKYVDVMMIF